MKIVSLKLLQFINLLHLYFLIIYDIAEQSKAVWNTDYFEDYLE